MLSLLRGQLKFLNQHFDVSAVASNDFKLPMLAEQEGIKTYGVNIRLSIKPLADLITLF